MPGAALAAAAAFASAEILLGLLVGRLAELGRADPLVFLAFRPWLLAIAAAAVARAAWRGRALFYSAALLLCAVAETLLLLRLGAREPWADMVLGLVAGAAAAVVCDLAVQAARRLLPRLGAIVAAVLLLAAFAVGALRPYESIVLGPAAPAEAAEKPPLLLMTALPLVWGEGGAFDPESRPDSSFLSLQREFHVRPIDAIEPPALRGARLMLLAQPRLLAPEELVALDDWVRGGGRVLILADPQLEWPSRWPPGDVRRAPQTSLLGPLLGHWGLRLEPAGGAAAELLVLETTAGTRRLVLDSPGRWAADGNSCRIEGRGLVARCRIGEGAALLVADADLLRSVLWSAAGGDPARHARIADNPLVVADWIDILAGVRRERLERPVDWAREGAAHGAAAAVAAAPILIALALGLGLLYAGRRSPTNLSTGLPIGNNTRTKEPPIP